MSVKVVRETTFANLMQKLTLIDYKRCFFPIFTSGNVAETRYSKVHTYILQNIFQNVFSKVK